MKVYSYNWATGEYIGDTEADPDPLEPGNYLHPAYTTPKEPPDINQHPGLRACFDKENDEWVLEPLPPPAPKEFDEEYKKLPMNHWGLLGSQTIGDLFDGK